MQERYNPAWAQSELIPFLETVFPEEPITEWELYIKDAEKNFDDLPFPEDFPLTIEGLRLSLINTALLTDSEMKKFARVDTVQLCVSIFVRHAIYHEVYPLVSLGPAANRDWPRHEVKRTDEEAMLRVGQEQWKLCLPDAKLRGVGRKSRKQGGGGKGKGKPREERSPGLRDFRSNRRAGFVSPNAGYKNASRSRSFEHRMPVMGFEAGSDPAYGSYDIASPMAAAQRGHSKHDQTLFSSQHHAQFGFPDPQQQRRQWGVNAVLESRSVPSSDSYYSDQFELLPATVLPGHLRHSVAPHYGDAPSFQPGMMSHHLRPEANDFRPGAGTHGF